MSSHYPTAADIERAIVTANIFVANDSMTPHIVIEDMVGLEAYRQFMHCFDTETLAAFAEDSLPLAAALDVAAHEPKCPLCRTDVADLRRVAGRGMAQLLAATPLWSTPFVGRTALRDSLGNRLQADTTPWLSLTAPSGVGKTRLALETAVEQAYLFPDGVCYVPLEGERDAGLIAMKLAQAAALPLSGKTPPQAQLRDFLHEKRSLFVLDDVPTDSEVLHSIKNLSGEANDLRFLLLGSEAADWPGKPDFTLPPLPLPAANRNPLLSESGQVFTGHVRSFQPDYAPDDAEQQAIATLCRKAAGIPMAIELAAAQRREMSAQEILRDMEARQVTAGRPDTSLADLTAWSYGLLSAREQRLLQQISVFAEGFFAEQAAAICEEEEAAALLRRLSERALLQRLETAGRLRYQLLAPIQRFARQQAGANLREVQARHSAYFLRYAKERADQLEEARQVNAMRDLAADLPNLRAGMAWAEEAGEARTAGGYGVALHHFFNLRGEWQESRERLRVAIGSFQRAADAEGEKQAKLGLARSLTRAAEYTEAEDLLKSVAIQAAEINDVETQLRVMRGLSSLEQFRGHYANATALIEEVLRHHETTGDLWNMADCQNNLGWLAWMQNENARAEPLFRESLAVYRERGDRYRLGSTLHCLGNIAYERGALEEARAWYQECLEARQELGDERGTASAMLSLGIVWQALGDFARADYCYRRAERHLERIQERRTLGQVRCQQGELALATGNSMAAQDYFASAHTLLTAVSEINGLAKVIEGLGRTAERQGDPAEAERCFRDSLRRFHAQSDKPGMATSLYYFGSLRAALGDLEAGFVLMQTAYLFCKENHRPETREMETTLQTFAPKFEAKHLAAREAQAAAHALNEAVAEILQEAVH